jgi:hypothetical protein
VGVRCGPRWYQLAVDLTGPLIRADKSRTAEFAERSSTRKVNWTAGEASVTADGTRTLSLHDRRIGRWGQWATFSPNGTALAVAGCTIEAHRREQAKLSLPFVEALALPCESVPWMMFRVELATSALVACEQTFENFAYPVAWSTEGDGFAFGTPFEPSVIWVARSDDTTLSRVSIPESVAMPLLDAAHLPELTSRLR